MLRITDIDGTSLETASLAGLTEHATTHDGGCHRCAGKRQIIPTLQQCRKVGILVFDLAGRCYEVAACFWRQVSGIDSA
ncbi:MAG: hypothetical protein ACLQVD_18570, partial [Capsulimonadaceae bacterium]